MNRYCGDHVELLGVLWGLTLAKPLEAAPPEGSR